MLKRIIYLITVFFFVTSCAGTWDSVKRGLTGQKKNSTDEFLVEKKDPLILPPDFEKLPTPKEQMDAKEEAESFKKILKKNTTTEKTTSSTATSTEESILERIKKQ